MAARALLAASLLLLAGCAGPRRDRGPALRHGSGLPDPEVVASAVSRLRDELQEDGAPPRWPGHLPRSRDFPELPLLRVDRVEDLGRTGGDMEALTRALEQALREARLARLSTDEAAVPGWLREGRDGAAEPPPARGAEHRKPGLALKGWTDRAGRLVLELHDLVSDERLARARSR